MVIINSTRPLASRFFTPALDLIPGCANRRCCTEIPDSDWLMIGVHRALMPQVKSSGRGLLHSLASLAPELCPKKSAFFEALKSTRRLSLLEELNSKVCQSARAVLPDVLACFPSLDGIDVYAADGHFHKHAVHDAADDKGSQQPVGHIYTRNLRNGMFSHLIAMDQIERDKEHDMRALKRTPIEILRQGAAKGRKVLMVYDRAVVDFRQWYQWKQGSGIYIITRTKTNMKLIKSGDLRFDRADPINAGVLADEYVGPSSCGVMLRRIQFYDAVMNRNFDFITNIMDEKIPPGVLAFLYRMRWNIEKTFDELKNKLGENKAWASSTTAKSMQAQFICLCENLLTLLDHKLEREEGVTNGPEIKRREKRLAQVVARLKKENHTLPHGLILVKQMTQHTVKLIRWVAAQIWLNNPWKEACGVLAGIYAVF